MIFHPASSISLYAFLLVVFSVIIAIVYATKIWAKDIYEKLLIFLIVWIALFSSLIYSGFLKTYIFPGMPLAFVGILVSAFIFALSSFGKALSAIPLWVLVLFHSFRLPLELILHDWSKTHTVPGTMTWTGQNIDIIAGALALLFLMPFFRKKVFIWIFNIVGSLLLLNVIRVVVMSSPFPFSWELKYPLQLLLHMPYAMIAFICVWAAVAGHIILSRALLKAEN